VFYKMWERKLKVILRRTSCTRGVEEFESLYLLALFKVTTFDKQTSYLPRQGLLYWSMPSLP
jgi:hypothetical protein